VISGFRREVDENCVLMGYYVASSGNSLPTFRDNLSVPSSGVKNPKGFWIVDPFYLCGLIEFSSETLIFTSQNHRVPRNSI